MNVLSHLINCLAGAANRLPAVILSVLASFAPLSLAAQTLPPAVEPPSAIEEISIDRSLAVLRWLDKVTGRVATAEVPVNAGVQIQTLEVIVRACRERPPEETPESAAFLDVWEIKPGEPASEVFRGWMFASSPALSAMEHAVYDLWILDCKDAEDEAPTAQ